MFGDSAFIAAPFAAIAQGEVNATVVTISSGGAISAIGDITAYYGS